MRPHPVRGDPAAADAEPGRGRDGACSRSFQSLPIHPVPGWGLGTPAAAEAGVAQIPQCPLVLPGMLLGAGEAPGASPGAAPGASPARPRARPSRAPESSRAAPKNPLEFLFQYFFILKIFIPYFGFFVLFFFLLF